MQSCYGLGKSSEVHFQILDANLQPLSGASGGGSTGTAVHQHKVRAHA